MGRKREKLVEEGAIAVSNLTKRYGVIEALCDVTLSLPHGAVGLLGPNGAGKSTLLKTLLGLVEPDAGSGTVLGYDIRRERLQIRRDIGYMPEDDCLYPDLTAVDHLRFCGRLSGMPRRDTIRRAHEILFIVGLGEVRYRKAGEYSTGMRQRLKLAQAFLHDPRLLFLDEPMTGLDPPGRAEMIELLREISRDKGIAIVLSSHVLADVEAVCSRVVLLRNGRVVREGRIADLQREVPSEANVRIKGDRARFIAHLEELGRRTRVLEGGIIEVARESDESLDFILRAAVAVGAQVRHLSSPPSTLESVFIDAMGGEGTSPRAADAA